MTTYGSVCSGVGGLDLAVEEVFGAHAAWHAELDKDASTVLARHWPSLPNLGDITAVDWSTVEPVDVLCGGYPCQPFSVAGKRKGKDDTRHLWPAVARAIGVLRPRLVVLENVSGHLRLGFDDVLADLAQLGFDAEWTTLRASEVGACHRRERLFVLAYPAGADDRGQDDGEEVGGPLTQRSPGGTGGPSDCDAPHAFGDALREQPVAQSRSSSEAEHGGDRPGPVAYPADAAFGDKRPCPELGPGGARTPPNPAGIQGVEFDRDGRGPAADADGEGRPRGRVEPRSCGGTDGERRGAEPGRRGGTDFPWGRYRAAIERHERAVGRPAPWPVVAGTRSLSGDFTAWMMMLPPNWLADDISNTAKKRLCGNAVVPLQAVTALRMLGASA